MKYPTLDDILAMYEAMMQRYGGTKGIRSPELLDSALNSPLATFGGQDLYPTLFDKAACLAYGLIQNHPFVDGNKRIGMLAGVTLLRMNGYTLHVTQEEFERVALAVAAGEMGVQDLSDWLLSNSTKEEEGT